MQGLAVSTCQKTVASLLAQGKDIRERISIGHKVDLHTELSQVLLQLGNAIAEAETEKADKENRRDALAKVTEESRLAALHGPMKRRASSAPSEAIDILEGSDDDSRAEMGIGHAKDFLKVDEYKNLKMDSLKERAEEGDVDAVQEMQDLQAGVSKRTGNCAGLGSGGAKQKKQRGFTDGSSPAGSSGSQTDSDEKPTGESPPPPPCLPPALQ